jgi:hypothetical protein
MALTGHLSDLSLSELIEFFCNQRKTGQLKVLYPQGHGHFYLQAGSVVDARIGVLRGIDAVYFALTLPNAKFEFGGADDVVERTINQPWTQVVLEGLRRLDEGMIPPTAFPPEYTEESNAEEAVQQETAVADLESLRVPGFLTLGSMDSSSKRKFMGGAAVAVAILASVAVLGVPAGWYGRNKSAVVVTQPEPQPVSNPAPEAATAPTAVEAVDEAPVASAENPNEALAAKRLRDKERAKLRDAALQAQTSPSPTSPIAPAAVLDSAKPGPKKVVVTVTYDESGRVTQASGGDASAVRIARQKRFPPGKAGSATVTIPIN